MILATIANAEVRYVVPVLSVRPELILTHVDDPTLESDQIGLGSYTLTNANRDLFSSFSTASPRVLTLFSASEWWAQPGGENGLPCPGPFIDAWFWANRTFTVRFWPMIDPGPGSVRLTDPVLTLASTPTAANQIAVVQGWRNPALWLQVEITNTDVSNGTLYFDVLGRSL